MSVEKILVGQTRSFKFTTVDPATGAPATLSGTPVISAYGGTSTTEITAGITLTVDFDSRTGFNNVTVVATSANGYASDTRYTLTITTGTVGGVSAVGYVVGEFTTYPRAIPEFGVLDYGIAQSATSTTLVLRSALTVDDDFLIGATILIYSASTGALQRRIITDWVSSTDTATVDTWGVTPTGTIRYMIFGSPVQSSALPFSANLTQFLGSAPTETTSGRLATNFSTFYDNADANTTKTVDDVGGGSGLDAAGVRAAVGLASANLDTQLDALPTAAENRTEMDSNSTQLAAVKAKTDSLTFTNAGEVDANIKSINDAEVIGDGNATPWDGI